MSAARWVKMADRLLAGRGASTIQWTRRELSSDGVAGTVTVTSSTTHSVRAAQLGPESRNLFGAEGWQTASVRIVVGGTLPFANETHSGYPEVRFDDVVSWLGVDRRVTFFDVWAAPGGPGQPPRPLCFFVGLGA